MGFDLRARLDPVRPQTALIGMDESFPRNNDACLSNYGDFALTLTAER